jgi:hypothetical protein
VQGYLPGRDLLDSEDGLLGFRDLVAYRSVVWTTRYNLNSFLVSGLQPLPGQLSYCWLAAYQQYVGNLFLAGDRLANSLVEQQSWMLPIVFDTPEHVLSVGGQLFYVGFGTIELPDGSELALGPTRYPYAALGLAVIDHVTPKYNIYGQVGTGSVGNGARNAACVGVKGLLLDPDFAAAHALGGVLADTIYTEALIDWKDLEPAYVDSLRPYGWSGEEFYDADIVGRPTSWSPQVCDAVPCVEPMFRLYSRYDWVDDLHAAAGDPDWPATIYTPEQLQTVCGQHALSDVTGHTLTTGRTLGFLSHKTVDTKPSGVADVVWGFDPYRFDRAQMKQALRWVLGQHFGLQMQP